MNISKVDARVEITAAPVLFINNTDIPTLEYQHQELMAAIVAASH